MEKTVQVAVRIRPQYGGGTFCLQTNSYLNQIIIGEQHVFPVTYALPLDCTQNQLFNTAVFPLLGVLLEGCDASVVTYGGHGSGKSYTLYGPGLHCAASEAEHGVVPRALRELFARLALRPERSYSVHIAWTQVCGENIQDLLGAGSVHCACVTDAFHWLQLGLSNRAPRSAHSLFTLTLEQQWVGADGLLQHRLSTWSFADLAGHEITPHLPADPGLCALDRVIIALTEHHHHPHTPLVPYAQSTLTTLLRDSFGGRAQTLVIACASPLVQDYTDTWRTLSFTARVQNVRNYVTTNSYSNVCVEEGDLNNEWAERNPPADLFGLQFAASQWLKLVAGAEELFQRLVMGSTLGPQDRDRISEWLCLKQECDECLSSEETISLGGVTEAGQRSLARIEEETESDTPALGGDDDDTPRDDAGPTDSPTGPESESETETDLDIHQQDLLERVDILLEKFKQQTDQIIYQNYLEHFKTFDNLTDNKETKSIPEAACSPSLHLQGARGRRKSIHPGTELLTDCPIIDHTQLKLENAELEDSSPEIEEKQKDLGEIVSSCADPLSRIRALTLNAEAKQNRIRQAGAELEGLQKQIDELQYTIQIKEQLIQDMIGNSETRSCAKAKFQKKRTKLEEDYYKARSELAQAENQLANCVYNKSDHHKSQVEKYRKLASFYERRLKDIESVRQIPEESTRKVLELESSLHTSRKQLERLQKQLRKEEKRKNNLELELITEKQKISELEQETNQHSLREVSARISNRLDHIEQVLKVKSIDLERTADKDGQESLRHEIRNMRKTRDCLVEQKCQLDHKLQKEKMLTDVEERKLLEYEEAIEAIDAAIELKNELICGRGEIDLSRLEREKGEEMLMQRLMKLSESEMRTLLYKYFQKVVDLRDSSKKLEMQLVQMERECETSAWRVQALSHALQQVRLEGERRVVLLQRQHEDKLNLMLRHLAEETSTGSSGERRAIERGGAAEQQPVAVTKYREETRDKNRFIARFQELTRYHHTDKRRELTNTIPTQNLRQLQPAAVQPPTKVTRQKNKLIIQQGKPSTNKCSKP